MTPLLQVEHIRYRYGNRQDVFRDISFSMERGDILAVIGPNGAGKSTLMNCLAGLNPPSSGRIQIDGCDILQTTVAQKSQLVGYMQQNVSIAYDYSVLDIVLMGRAPYISTMRLPSIEDRRIASDALSSMGIASLSDRPFTELSGGEKQQVLIARLLAQRPQLIIMDEPTSALDFGNQQRTIQMIRSLAENGFAVIITTHNPDHAILLGGRVAAIDREGQFFCGSPDEVLTDDTLCALYGVAIKVEHVPAFGRKVCAYL